MAGTAAIAQLIDRVADGIRLLILLVRIGSVLVGMATRTIGLVGRERIGLRRAVGRVAIRAVRGVVPGRDKPRGVRIADAGPGCGAVTIVTLQRCHEVSGRFAGRRYAVVTGRTTARNLCVIEADRCPVRCRYVAGIAGI